MSGYLHLRFDTLEHEAPACVWPAGYRLCPFTPEKAPALHALLAEAYRHGGGTVAPFGEWWRRTSGDSEFDPALCFLVEDADGQLAAGALCWTSAFVKDIAVREASRHLGLGQALLAHMLTVFHARGFHAVELKVEKDNPSGAVGFYRRFGFRPKNRFIAEFRGKRP
jgi:ribosomal protein S18 acetylase RimI-like enzyme